MAITSFSGKYKFLSNFYLCKVEYEGITYPSSEHAFQAAKTLVPELRKAIAKLDTPGQAKRAGRMLYLRPFWEETKLEIMEQIVRIKFQQDSLADLLIDTWDQILVEGNNWGDTYWGAVAKGGKFQGQNHLGKILMKVRDDLRLQREV